MLFLRTTSGSSQVIIGVSARIYDPSGPVLDLGGVWTKTFHHLAQSVADLRMRGGALPVMISAADSQSLVQREALNLGHYANALDALDALVLQGPLFATTYLTSIGDGDNYSDSSGRDAEKPVSIPW